MIHVTLHSLLHSDTPRYPRGGTISVVGPKVGPRIDLDISGGVDNSPATEEDVLARITCTEDCVIEIGIEAVADPDEGEMWFSGDSDVRFIPAGHRVSAILPS